MDGLMRLGWMDNFQLTASAMARYPGYGHPGTTIISTKRL